MEANVAFRARTSFALPDVVALSRPASRCTVPIELGAASEDTLRSSDENLSARPWTRRPRRRATAGAFGGRSGCRDLR
jgi:hypothetical protein